MRWVALVVLLLLLSVSVLWAVVRSREGPLPGLRIAGHELEDDESLPTQLKRFADIYADELVVIHAGSSQEKRMRRELGASLEIGDVMDRAMELGRSGNPVADLKKWWLARSGRLDLPWAPSIDTERLGAFVSRERDRVELPPKAGVTDGEGWSLPGEDGITLDYHQTMNALTRALTAGKFEVVLALRKVPQPEPVLIGSPDGALFDDPETEEPADAAPVEGVPTGVAQGIEWQPSRGNECYEKPPLRPFCDGPRMVPAPVGPAAATASELGLGQVSAVRKLLGGSIDPRWVSAAGGPRPTQRLLWPVPAGKFGRGFGFVRKRAEVKDRLHKGVDMPAGRGSAIRAASDAIVAYSDNGIRGYGNLLILVQADGAVTLNAHCRRIFVFAGQRVRTGQIVAEVGSTGMAMGPHLHFEYHVGGEPRDPLALFDQMPSR